jgi:hypothetical protein
MLRPVKGGVVGYMTRMGFLDQETEPDSGRGWRLGDVRKEDGRG